VKLRVDRGFALFVFPLIPFPKLQNSCGALSFPGVRGGGSKVPRSCGLVARKENEKQILRAKTARRGSGPRSARNDRMVYHVYILASATGVLYVGVTNNLERRVAQHKEKRLPGFTKRYSVTRLVYFEAYG
jgi:GIY-YIG catalytic domain